MVGLFQSYAIALDSLYHLVDGSILSNDSSFQFLSHTFQSDTFFLSHTLGRHARHHRYYFGHLLSSYCLWLFIFAFCPALVQSLQFFFQYYLAVSIASGQFKVLALYCQLLSLLQFGNLTFLLDNLGWNLGIT